MRKRSQWAFKDYDWITVWNSTLGTSVVELLNENHMKMNELPIEFVIENCE